MPRARWRVLGVLLLASSLAAPLAGAPLPRDVAPRQLHTEPSPLARVIAGVEQAPQEARRELAMLIVGALVEAYESELGEALRGGMQDPGGRRKLSRWHQAAAPVLLDLRSAQADLYAAQRVELHADRHGQILLLIDGRPLWVAWPRVALQDRLEREVASTFCRRHECPEGKGVGSAPAPTEASAVQGNWVLSQGRPPGWETSDGLRCEFPDLSDRDAREATCRELAVDVYALAAALQRATARGERIEWADLALLHDNAGGRHRVVVNGRGDYIEVALPVLAVTPVDWGQTRRWLGARVEGRAVVATVLRVPEGG